MRVEPILAGSWTSRNAIMAIAHHFSDKTAYRDVVTGTTQRHKKAGESSDPPACFRYIRRLTI